MSVGFWQYRLLPKPERGPLYEAIRTWHHLNYPRCGVGLRDAVLCNHLRALIDGIRLAKVHPELLAGIAVALDAEHLVREEGE